MFIDHLMELDPPNTAITVTADSTNVFDMAGPAVPASPAGREIALGPKLSVRWCIQAAFAAAGAATATFSISEAPDNAGVPGAYVVIAQTPAIGKANLVAGAFVELPIPPNPPGVSENPPPRFLKTTITVATGPFTAGQVQTEIVSERVGVDSQIYYPRNFSV